MRSPLKNEKKLNNNLKKICQKHLNNKCTIEIIDLSENPELAKEDQILAIPTLVRKLPEPVKKIIGTLANEEKVLIGLEINPRDSNIMQGNLDG